MAALRTRDDISSAELRRQARRENDGRVSARLIARANALDGRDRAQAARLAGMDRQSLRDWAHRDNAEGIAGLSHTVARATCLALSNCPIPLEIKSCQPGR